MSSVESRRRDRINLRVDSELETRLRAAAEANGESLTGFMLAAAAEKAEHVLARARRIDLSAAAFDRFVAALDGETEPMPVLTSYARKRSPIPER